jgi:transposase-like protein
MIKCIFCGNLSAVKDGIVCGKQRYKCKECKKKFRIGAREGLKSKDLRVKIVRSYINGVGFRAISRIFEIPLSTIFYFIKRIYQN